MLISRPTIILCKSIQIQCQTCHGCFNRGIVVSLCSELLMRLSYYIYLGFGKKLVSHEGIEPGSVQTRVVYLTQNQSANSNYGLIYVYNTDAMLKVLTLETFAEK